MRGERQPGGGEKERFQFRSTRRRPPMRRAHLLWLAILLIGVILLMRYLQKMGW